MKRESAITLSIAAAAFTLLFTQIGQAQEQARNMKNPPIAQSNTTLPDGAQEAMLMVPARAALVEDLDSKKIQSGQQFRVTLSKTVHLKNGIELPNGTTLIGVVTADHMQEGGKSRLVLRFTKAELKDGKVVPIKATILSIYRPESTSYNGYPVVPGDQEPNDWRGRTLQVDQIGVLNGIDLHSKISSRNSGALVSTKKDNMKLQAGSEFELAIAARKSR